MTYIVHLKFTNEEAIGVERHSIFRKNGDQDTLQNELCANEVVIHPMCIMMVWDKGI